MAKQGPETGRPSTPGPGPSTGKGRTPGSGLSKRQEGPAKEKPNDWVTYERLKRAKACYLQRAKFRKEWPDGCRLTRKNLTRAAHLGLNLDWLGYMLYRERLEPAVRAFDKARFESTVRKENDIDRLGVDPLDSLSLAERRARVRGIAQACLRHRVRMAGLIYRMVADHGLSRWWGWS